LGGGKSEAPPRWGGTRGYVEKGKIKMEGEKRDFLTILERPTKWMDGHFSGENIRRRSG